MEFKTKVRSALVLLLGDATAAGLARRLVLRLNSDTHAPPQISTHKVKLSFILTVFAFTIRLRRRIYSARLSKETT